MIYIVPESELPPHPYMMILLVERQRFGRSASCKKTILQNEWMKKICDRKSDKNIKCYVYLYIFTQKLLRSTRHFT